MSTATASTAQMPAFIPFNVPARGAFHHEAALALLTAHAVPGLECVDATVYERLLQIAGTHYRVRITLHADGVSGEAAVPVELLPQLVTKISAWFDLATDIAGVERTLGTDPLLGPLIAKRPGLRLIGSPHEFEAVAATIIGQQVSLAAARTFASRMVQAYGERHGDLHAYPTPQVLAALDQEALRATIGLTKARARTLHAAAERWAAGPVLAGLTADEARPLLLALPGVGPWTADYLLVRELQDPDTFVPTDLVVRRALALDARAAADRSASWAPYRSYALLHLWTEASYL